MNKTITSKDLLLTAAKEIAQQDGFEKLSIRGVASKCGVSIGSIYNYFPDKDSMIHSIIDDFLVDCDTRNHCRINLFI